jgi:hypothetical protein
MDEGISDCMGVDGDYVSRDDLLIPQECFMALDLSTAKPLGRRFDLVMSLEVAEHLSPEFADAFISFLVAHGDVVLFSAAAPLQTGTDHRNEQWPVYWARKFASHGYTAVDGLRLWLLADADVDWWYSQNVLIYARKEALNKYPRLAAMPCFPPDQVASLVHPKLLERWTHLAANRLPSASLRELMSVMPVAVKRSIAHRLRRR